MHKQGTEESNTDEHTMEEKLSSLDSLNDERLDSKSTPEPAEIIGLFV